VVPGLGKSRVDLTALCAVPACARESRLNDFANTLMHRNSALLCYTVRNSVTFEN